MLFNVQIDRNQPQYFISTEVDINTPWRQVSPGTRMVHQQRHMPRGKNKLERDFKLVRVMFIFYSTVQFYEVRKYTLGLFQTFLYGGREGRSRMIILLT